MLLFETIAVSTPDPYVIAGGLAALGLPPAFRFDVGRNGKGKDDE